MRGIYKITNTIDNKCYIGKSEDLQTRMMNHIKSLNNGTNKNKHMQAAFTLYGASNFIIGIIEELGETDNINEREKYWINYYKSNQRQFGYNMTEGGDGGNSYVDCMSDEEKKKHYEKHKEIRRGKNNCNYGKHLFHKGDYQKYFSDNEIEQCIQDGWTMGAADYIKEKLSKRNAGVNNPFYGKHHSQEVIDRINETKKNNNFTPKGKLQYYKEDKIKMIDLKDVEQYEREGWVHGTPSHIAEKIKNTKKLHPISHKWDEKSYKKHSRCFMYENNKYYGMPKLIEYLRKNGYPSISRKGIENLINGKTRLYSSLLGKIQIIKEDI